MPSTVLDEFAALGLLRDEVPVPLPVPPVVEEVVVPPQSPRALPAGRVHEVLARAATSAGSCVQMLTEAAESMQAVQEALLSLAEELDVEPETVEMEAEEPPPPPPPPAPVVALRSEVRAPAVEDRPVAPAASWVAEPKPFGAAAVMVEASVPLPPEE